VLQLPDGGRSVVAGRLAGALRNIGKNRMADDIINTMKKADYDVLESDPFTTHPNFSEMAARQRSHYVNRIRMMRHSMREVIIAQFPHAPGLPKDSIPLLRQVNKIFITHAYHSLSIKDYSVTPELIEKVRILSKGVREHHLNRIKENWLESEFSSSLMPILSRKGLF
jgi:hypothetical protein